MTLTTWSRPVQRLSRQLSCLSYHTHRPLNQPVRVAAPSTAKQITYNVLQRAETSTSNVLSSNSEVNTSTPITDDEVVNAASPLHSYRKVVRGKVAPSQSALAVRNLEQWYQRIGAVLTTYDPRSSRDRILRLPDHALWPEAPQWAFSILHDPQESVLTAQTTHWRPGVDRSWETLPLPGPAQPLAVWTSAMLHTVSRGAPASAAALLDLTYDWSVTKSCHPSTVPNVLWAIVAKSRPSLSSDPVLNMTLVDLLYKLYTTNPACRARSLPGDVFAFLLKNASSACTLRLYQLAQDPLLRTNALTMLHVSTALMRHGLVDDAADCLVDAAQRGLDPNDPIFQRVCTTVLHQTGPMPQGLRSSIDIFERLAKLGLRANIHICNVLIRNAALIGDLRTVWSVYNSLVTHGLTPSEHTFSTMLNACKTALDDTENTHRTIQEVIGSLGRITSIHVATSIIHVLYQHHFANPNKSSRDFSRLAAAYSTMFDTACLDFLDLSPQHDILRTSQTDSAAPLLQPNVQVLTMMVSARCQEANDKGNYVSRPLLFGSLHRLALAGHEPYAQLLETDHIWNELVHSSLRVRDFATACRVIYELLDPASKSLITHPRSFDWDRMKDLPRKTSSAVTARTWSVLLEGVTQYRQIFERLLIFMHDSGIEPTMSDTALARLVNDHEQRLLDGGFTHRHTKRLVEKARSHFEKTIDE